jgi:pimeloyl-ACP methyl ester carboxylesterase
MRLRRSGLPLLIILVLVSSSGCISAKRTPNLERIFRDTRGKTGKRPIIVIPGVLGSELINSKTGRVVWPALLRTEDEGLPMSPDLSANRDDLVPGKIIETVNFSKVLPEVYVYRDLLEALRNYAGYREADLNNPPVDGDKDTFYVFPYDWRRDNVENARELIRRIERLKDRLNRPDLRFTILAHSMGGLIARYAAMYGNADIPPGDQPIVPSWAGAADISKIVMLGVPNEGTADALATLIYGYSITEGLRRRVPLLNKLTAADAMRAPAVFQLLPHRYAARILDEDLKSLPVDFCDPETWKRYGWSAINDPEFRQRYAREHPGEDSLARLDAYLAAVLHRAKRFQEALDVKQPANPPVLLLAIGGDCEETLRAPLVLRDVKRDRWVTVIRPRDYVTSTGKKVKKRELTELMYAPGDGRVTRSSLLGENLPGGPNGALSSPLALTYAVFGCDLHGQLQRNKTLQDNALTAILAEAMK